MQIPLTEDLVRPLAQIPGGCFVLTASHESNATGILVSWVQQAGFDPPVVTVAVKRDRPICKLIEKSGYFTLNTIGEAPETSDIYKRFAQGAGDGKSVFEGLKIEQHTAGVVLSACLGHLACRVTGTLETGDHILYAGTVIGGEVHAQGQPGVRIRSNGLNY